MSARNNVRDYFSYESLCQTIERLSIDDIISNDEKQKAIGAIHSDKQGAQYILKHLSVHLSIGGFRVVTMIPIPFGSILRPLWVLLWRVIETLKGNKARAEIHSFRVFIFSVIPLVGYTAYLLALRKSSERFTFIVANHLCYAMKNTNVIDFYKNKSAMNKRLITMIVPPLSDAFEN
jgi:hypothetical protein